MSALLWLFNEVTTLVPTGRAPEQKLHGQAAHGSWSWGRWAIWFVCLTCQGQGLHGGTLGMPGARGLHATSGAVMVTVCLWQDPLLLTQSPVPVPLCSDLKLRVRILIDGTLIIFRVKPEDAGKYTCVPSNSLGRSPSASAYLTVQCE